MARRKIIDTPDPAVAWAEKLVTRLVNAWLEFDAAIIDVIENKAWEPLGYGTWTELWDARLSHIRFVAEMRPHVVYQMYVEGATPEEVAGAVKGVGPEEAASFKRELESGVPASLATGRKPRQSGTSKLAYTTIFVKVPAATARQWTRAAKKHDTTVEKVALPAIEQAFKDLA
jgi:hypothetical protein